MNTLISCQKVNKKFGTKHVLKDVNFELAVGETTALVGPNGAGKTTLFSLLCNYHLPSSGDIKILGHEPGSTQLFNQINALPQDAQLDPRFAIKHQLELYAKLQGFSSKEAKAECLRVLEQVDLRSSLNERPSALSHGMSKRITIAQALIGAPKLIMLDEPTAGLDPTNARNIRQLIMNLSGETSFIISSHNLDELEKLCSTVLLLNQGYLSQQIIGQEDKANKQTITLQIEPSDFPIAELLQEINAVIAVKAINKQEFVVDYNAQTSPDIDIKLIQTLYDNNINYRQITKGLSLEQQLFSS